MLKEIDRQLDTLYRAYEDGTCPGIWTHLYLEGAPINFRFCQEDTKYSRITTGPNFSDWAAGYTGDWKKAAPVIERLVNPYGVAWDSENGALFLRFRRNEMTIAQAVLRLQQAVSLVSALRDAD